MFLFLLSFLIIFTSTYLLVSLFKPQKYLTGLIYLFLIFFAQIVLSMELLSLLQAISKTGILLLNVLFLFLSLILWLKNGKPLYKPLFFAFWAKIFAALKKDNQLLFMGLGWTIFILINIFICIFIPVCEYDSLAYHFNRALVWASQGSVAHFDIGDTRNLYMPINSEIIYTWFLSFVYENTFIRFLSFISYLFMCVVLYSILEIWGFCVRKRLWAIFIISAISGVMVSVSGVESNTLVGALSLSCVGLFLLAVKNNTLISVYFSSLAFSLAIGTKTTAFFLAPMIFVLLAHLALKYNKNLFKKYFLIFCGFAALNILIFAAYNYILNYINYGSIIGPQSAILSHKSLGGTAGVFSGIIKHFAMLLDFSGFEFSYFINKYIYELADSFISFWGIPLTLNEYNIAKGFYNFKINEMYITSGFVGVLVGIPIIIGSLLKSFYSKSCKLKILALLGTSLFVNIVIMSCCLIYMPSSARFITTFWVFTSPVLALSYIKSNKNIFKYIVMFLVLINFIYLPLQIQYRELTDLFYALKNKENIVQIREDYICVQDFMYGIEMPFCKIRRDLYSLPANSKIGVFSGIGDNVAVLKLMEKDGYKIDFLLTESVNEYDLNSYDYLVFTTKDLRNMIIKSNTVDLMHNYYLGNDEQVVFKNKMKAPCVVAAHNDGDNVMTLEDVNSKTPLKLMCKVPFELLDIKGFKLVKKIQYIGYIKNLEAKVNDEYVIFKRANKNK